MAFPQVAATAFSAETADTTSHGATIPAGVSSGNLLIMHAGLYWPTDEPSVTGMPAGWTLVNRAAAASKAVSEVWYKIADGTETNFSYGSDGVSCTSMTRLYRVTDWHGTTAPEGAGADGPFSAEPNPPSLSPSWGAEDTLWFVCTAVDSGAFTDWPTNYSDNQNENDWGGERMSGYRAHRASSMPRAMTQENSPPATTEDGRRKPSPCDRPQVAADPICRRSPTTTAA